MTDQKDSSQELKGVRVLITRPRPQAEKLADYLRQLGAETVIMPMLEICPCTADELPLPIDIAKFDKAIVVSTSAAESLLKQHPRNMTSVTWFTPGRATGDFLASLGFHVESPTTQFTSEAMLQLPELQDVRDQRILLVKGEGGRDLLEQTLRERGATVTALTVYRRSNPHYDVGVLDRTLEEQEVNAIVATSGQIVTNLISHCSEATLLRELFLLVPSTRVSDIAKQAGFTKIQIAASAGDCDIAASLKPFV